MTAVDTAQPLRLDRYLALLAILMALVFGLLVIGERQQSAPGAPAIEGRLPPPAAAAGSDASSPGASSPGASNAGDMPTRAELARRLETTEEALRRAEAEIERLREENRVLSERLENQGAGLDAITRRLAAAEAERDRLSKELEALTETRDRLEARLAEAHTPEAQSGAANIPPPPSAVQPSAGSQPSSPAGSSAAHGADSPAPAPELAPPARDPSATVAAQPTGLQAALEALMREQQAQPVRPAPDSSAEDSPAEDSPAEDRPVQHHQVQDRSAETTREATGEVVDDAVGDRGSDGDGGATAESAEAAMPSRLITFDGEGGSVAVGVEAYRAGDFVMAERIWGPLAASGNPRAQFHFGALMYEGRTTEPDLVMAYVWLSRAVDGGHLPAIDLRRDVRAAMSEAQYREALAIRADG